MIQIAFQKRKPTWNQKSSRIQDMFYSLYSYTFEKTV